MNIFGIHAKALLLRQDRANIIASNITNAETPGYLSKDLDVSAKLSQTSESGFKFEKTSLHHKNLALGASEDLLYRTPSQPSLDGNTVDLNLEQAAYSKNAVDYMASLRLLNARVKSLMSVIRGE